MESASWKAAFGAALSAVVLAVTVGSLPAQASGHESGDQSGGAPVVINEAYLSGGSAGAAYRNKFIELYNTTDSPVNLSGWSLQYRSAGGTAAPTGVAPLNGTIGARSYFLIQANSNGSNGAALPQTDAVTSLSPSATTGTLVLARRSTALGSLGTGSIIGHPDVVDLLGYGTSNTYETRAASSPAGTKDVRSFNRTAFADTNNNFADFSLATSITPAGSSGGAGETEPPAVNRRTIAEIQGTGFASPFTGQTVTTRGRVTAAYPTGGFNGYYIQTPGTGGDDAAARSASDAIFVFSRDTVGSVRVGDFVEVTGTVSEFFGLTELTVPAGGLSKLSEPSAEVKPSATELLATAVAREHLEGMLLAPQGPFTVTNNFALNQFGEIGLAAGTEPLVQPTAAAPYGSAGYHATVAENAERAVRLDDGASTNFLASANKSRPLPYLTVNAGGTDDIRVGSAVGFSTNVIFDYRNNSWKFQPLSELTPANAASVQPAVFSKTRTASPEQVGGNVRLASFNVLNYFTTTGDQLEGCTYFSDREGNPISVRSGCEARGAANAENLARQQAKIVAAISALDADVVALEEIENSAKFGKDRDTALVALTAALNEAEPGTWEYVRSPSVLPELSREDVIRTAFIYRPDVVQTIDESVILDDDVTFSNARKPLAQTFKVRHGGAGTKFIAVANHFKSKGSAPSSGENADHGQGAWNAARTSQAEALVAFAEDLKSRFSTDKVFLMGDFNAYDQEDPLRVLTDAGYVSQGAKTGEHTYTFNGMVGSLDHVFASPSADAVVAGTDIWNINSVESVALEYSRFNYNINNYYSPDQYRASDHDPIIVGLDLPTARVAARLR